VAGKQKRGSKCLSDLKQGLCKSLYLDRWFQIEIRARSVSEIVQESFSLFHHSDRSTSLNLWAVLGLFPFRASVRSAHRKIEALSYLPVKVKKEIQQVIPLSDCQISTVAKDYYSDKSFCRDADGNIDLWRVYNLFHKSQ
jgi:hypothetical protein